MSDTARSCIARLVCPFRQHLRYGRPERPRQPVVLSDGGLVYVASIRVPYKPPSGLRTAIRCRLVVLGHLRQRDPHDQREDRQEHYPLTVAFAPILLIGVYAGANFLSGAVFDFLETPQPASHSPSRVPATNENTRPESTLEDTQPPETTLQKTTPEDVAGSSSPSASPSASSTAASPTAPSTASPSAAPSASPAASASATASASSASPAP